MKTLKLQIESAIGQAVLRDHTDIFNLDVALQQEQNRVLEGAPIHGNKSLEIVNTRST